MALTFDHIINLTTYAGNPSPAYVQSMLMSNEPSNDINHFYILDTRTANKESHITLSNYTSLIWSKPKEDMTKAPVKRIGMKNFPRIGSIAFYSLLNEERSYVLAPLFIEEERYKRPTFTAVAGTGNVTFTMTSPSGITYLCWRVVMRIGAVAFEYITYENTLTVDNPYLTGSYDCYCVGYVGEGQAVSDDSEHVTLSLTGSGTDPLDRFEYYTKSEVNALIAAIKVNVTYAVELLAANWQGAAAPYTQTVQLSGVALTGYAYVVSPTSDDWSKYCASGIYMNEPTVAGSITFTATGSKPTEDLSVNVLKVGVT